MKNHLFRARLFPVIVAVLLVGSSLVGSSWAQAPAPSSQAPASDTAQAALPAVGPVVGPVVGKDWIVKATDNICGLKDANQLSNPAVVDYEALLSNTPEMKQMRDQKIDPNSPEGIRLANAAADRVQQACETVRSSLGHCSVWKEIRHRDGRTITDITNQVKAQF
jgi:hypothetical protein